MVGACVGHPQEMPHAGLLGSASVRMVLASIHFSAGDVAMSEKDFGVLISKNTLSDADFNRRAEELLGGNVRRDLHVQIARLSAEDEVEALALILTFRKAFSEEEKEVCIFRVDRLAIQRLIDVLYDLVKYEKS